MSAIRGFKSCRPLGDYMLVEVVEAKETEGGLVIPETARQEVPPYAIVVSVGPEIKDIAAGDCVYPRIGASLMRCHVGDRAGDMFLLRRDQITAIVEPPDAPRIALVNAASAGALQ